jgi:hypothetical protein
MSVLEIWENETRLVEGHNEIPIPWKPGLGSVNDNSSVAISRVKSLKASLIKRGLYQRYDDEVKVLSKGYAEVATEMDP